MKKLLALTLMTAVTLAACSTEKSDSAEDSAAMMPAAGSMSEAPAPAAPAAPAVTDPQIAAIVVAANTVDIEAGRLAATKSANAKVKAFANMMVKDHNAVNKTATDLVTKLNVTPEDNPTAQSLKAGGETNVTALKSLTGAAFDRAYMANEVAYHQAVIDAVDKTLIPNAQNAELKTLLEQSRPAFAAHLKAAQELQASLGQ